MSNVENKNESMTFSSILILFGSNFFYIDNIIEKLVSAVFYIYNFDFVTHFYNTFTNTKLFLIHYLCSEMVITILPNILSNCSKY